VAVAGTLAQVSVTLLLVLSGVLVAAAGVGAAFSTTFRRM
jgi:hypothetical protein